MNPMNDDNAKKVVKRIIEQRTKPSTGRKVVRGIGIGLVVLGILWFLASMAKESPIDFVLSIFQMIVGLLMIRVGRTRVTRQEITEEQVSTVVEEEEHEELKN